MYIEIKFYGVVLYDKVAQEKFFACCASPHCYEESMMIKLSLQTNENDEHKWITSNAVRHLDSKHGILSEASKKKRNKITNEEEERLI